MSLLRLTWPGRSGTCLDVQLSLATSRLVNPASGSANLRALGFLNFVKLLQNCSWSAVMCFNKGSTSLFSGSLPGDRKLDSPSLTSRETTPGEGLSAVEL